MRGESAGPAQVVIGIGINMRMPAAVRLMLAEQQAVLIADMHEIMRERTPARNALIAMLVEEVVEDAADVRRAGLRAVRRRMAAARYARRCARAGDQRHRDDIRPARGVDSTARCSSTSTASCGASLPAKSACGRALASWLSSSTSATRASSGRVSRTASCSRSPLRHMRTGTRRLSSRPFCTGARSDRVLVSNVTGARMAEVVAHRGCAGMAHRSAVRDFDAAGRRYSQCLSAAGEARCRSLARHDRRACARARSRVHRQCRHGHDDRRSRLPTVSHLGGVIVPGPDLMIASLLTNTSDIAQRASRAQRAMPCSQTTRWARSGKARSMRLQRWSSVRRHHATDVERNAESARDRRRSDRVEKVIGLPIGPFPTSCCGGWRSSPRSPVAEASCIMRARGFAATGTGGCPGTFRQY